MNEPEQFNAGGIASRPSTLAECLVVLKARLSDHLSPAENREIDEAIRFVCGYDSCAPKGWKLVPLQPTAEMLKAGAYSTISSDSRTAIYAAMLAVAPDAPFDEIPQGWGDVRSESVTRLTLDNERQVFFYEQDHYYLSNFSAFRVRYEGHWFDTSEQAYHYQRFTDRHHRSAIRASSSAHEAFRYAQDNKADQRPDWDAVKVDIMRCILCAKADQHEYVRRKLLQTGDRELVENSWRDPFWGWGENRDGKNMLGVLWMQVRNQLRLQETSNAER